ncbi:uncharacterized protein BDZ83DRAFT_647861 [Colletotrichum acutatum]|uniref:MmgE/PrpD N-terminal domain-containing protein n=1 Tax=Glomerella acutata TaxID=27357 RepID=A0AAD9D0E0_GLOAC|nr:uncharacterized protein BDZ83DRAFT_647861 [Colletotrichum acutatum]KAK1729579.1 hypothetical protein BDZ83DRAFT_647861 [Colletotrichum acutatum]
MTAGNYTMELASFAASLTSKALPKTLYSSLPIFVLDIVTAMLTGMVQPVYKSPTEALTTIHGNGGPQSVAAIDGSETTIFGAMYLNGIATGAFQIEHVVLNAHPSSSVLHALLVYASTRNTTTTGEDFLTALAAAYDVCARIGLASSASVEDERGFHNPAINGQLAAAATVGNLLGWDAEAIASAMGVAASSSGGLVAFQTTDAKTKQIHPGHGGPLGIEAALMARAGVTGPPDILENEMGFLHAFSPEPNATALTDQLGDRWDCEATTAKHYPMHLRFQTLVTGIQDYKKQDPWDKEVKGVTAYVGPRLLREAHQIAHPETLDQAQYSVLFCLAASVLLDLSSPFVYNGTLVGDEAVQKLSGEIGIEQVYDDEKTEGGYVIVSFSDYSTVNITAPYSGYTGLYANPGFLEALVDKYNRTTRALSVEGGAQSLRSLLENMWTETNLFHVYNEIVKIGQEAHLD